MNRLWLAFVGVMVVSFLVLGWIGTRIYQEMPPIPVLVTTSDGQTLIGNGEITAGQNVWQSLGGMEVGSIWGHGSYVAPDWTADWLHREAIFILNRWAKADYSSEYAELDNEQQAQLVARLTKMLHTNTYDPSTGAVTVDVVRARRSNRTSLTTPRSSHRAMRTTPFPQAQCPTRIVSASCRPFSSGPPGRLRPIGPMTSAATRTIGRTNR